MQTHLLALTGVFPAVLTETVWALAHETPPTIPDEIFILTTSRGAQDLRRELCSPRPDLGHRTLWQTLRQAILGPNAERDPRLTLHDPQIFSIKNPALGQAVPLEDIRTPADNAAAAECILDEVRRITANPEVRLVASLAGGRKTMSALLAMALSLEGRNGDRLTHVLVNEPFDHPDLQPRFYFPTDPPSIHHLDTPAGSPQIFTSDHARLFLADVPFVPLRDLIHAQLGRRPNRFHDLVNFASSLVSANTEPVALDYHPDTHTATFDGTPVELANRDIPFFVFLFEHARSGHKPFLNHTEAEAPFAQFLARWAPQHPEINLEFQGHDWRKKPPEAADFRKRLNSLRERLRQAGLGYLIQRLLPPYGQLGFPLQNVTFPHDDRSGPAQKIPGSGTKTRKKGGVAT